MRPFLLVISSPSGGGKSTIARRLLETRDDCGYSVSATTRAPRAGEQNGVHYHFLTPDEFRRRVEAGEFVESAPYGDAQYGTLKSEVESVLGTGRNVVLDIEVEGARQVRRNYPDSVHVFLLPPSGDSLVNRLRGRRTEDSDAVRRRLEIADRELAGAVDYDYLIVNDDLDHAVGLVSAVIDAESRRPTRWPELKQTIEQLRRELNTTR